MAYWPALHGGLVWDDAAHVTRPELRSLGGLWRIWFDLGATQQYYPLLHSAFWLESHLWGDATLGYHLVNVLLHATAACLIATTLRRLNVPGGWFAAALFALHPVGVESVAWISEQKNTLSLVLYLCAALTYLRFEADGRARWYVGASALFLAALATKTVTATLPAALLVLAWWRRGRIDLRRDVVPLLPWFGFALAAGLLTAWVERTLIGAQGESFQLDTLHRVPLAGRVVWFYLGKLIWPADLMFVYPRWNVAGVSLWAFATPIAAVALAIALFAFRRRGLLAAYLFFVGSLFPALGFVNVYPFIYSFVADHFQYLASVGVWAAVGAGIALAWSRFPRLAPWFFAGLAIVLGTLTWRQAGTYRDEATLYEATLRRNPACWMAHNNLAAALTRAGRPAEALPHLEAAVALKPTLAGAENNFGDALRQLGRVDEAIPHLERALQLQPDFAGAHINLGLALTNAGRVADGLHHLEEAVRLSPKDALAHYNLGFALATTGRAAEALPHFAEAVRLQPDFADAQLNLAIGLGLTGHFADAVPHFIRAIALDPKNPRARLNYGRALASAGHYGDATSEYRATLELNPANAQAHFELGTALRQLGRANEAAEEFELAQRIGAGGR